MTQPIPSRDLTPCDRGDSPNCRDVSRTIPHATAYLNEGAIFFYSSCDSTPDDATAIHQPAGLAMETQPRTLSGPVARRRNRIAVGLLAGFGLLLVGSVGLAAQETLTLAQATQSPPGTAPASANSAPVTPPPATPVVKPAVPSPAQAQVLAEQALGSLPELAEATSIAEPPTKTPAPGGQQGALPVTVPVAPAVVVPEPREWKNPAGRVIGFGTFRGLRNGVEVVVRAPNGELALFALPSLSRADLEYVLAQVPPAPPEPVAVSARPGKAPVTSGTVPAGEPPRSPHESASADGRPVILVPVGPSSRRNRRGDFIRDFRPQLVPVELPEAGEPQVPLPIPPAAESAAPPSVPPSAPPPAPASSPMTAPAPIPAP